MEKNIAKEIQGKTGYEAEKILISHGFSEAGTAAVIAMFTRGSDVIVTGSIEDLTQAIKDEVAYNKRR